MDLVRILRRGDYLAYYVILLLTAAILTLAMYMAVLRIYEVFNTLQNLDALGIALYNALSDIFLVVVFVELIDTFITYGAETRRGV